MLSQKFRDALKRVSSELNELDVEWAVIGSTNLAIHGMQVKPNDLDLVVPREKIFEVEKTFSDHVREEVTEKTSGKDSLKFYETKLDIQGIEIHILGESEDDIYFSKVVEGRREFMDVKNIKVPCLTLENEAQAYSETDREEKAEKIREFMA